MRPLVWLVPGLLGLGLLLAAQDGQGARYHQLLDNDYVLVSSLELPAGFHAPAENLRDVVWVAVDDATLTLVPSQGERKQVELKAGDTRLFRSFQVREFLNSSPQPFRSVVVELKRRGVTADGCFCFGSIERAVCGCGQPGHLPSLWAVGIGGITLAGTTLSAGQSFQSAVHRNDSLLVAVTPVELRDAVAGSPADVELKPGEVLWMKEGGHRFQNVGAAVARFVTIEF